MGTAQSCSCNVELVKTIKTCKRSCNDLMDHTRSHRHETGRKSVLVKRSKIIRNWVTGGMPFTWFDWWALRTLFRESGYGGINRYSAVKCLDRSAQRTCRDNIVPIGPRK